MIVTDLINGIATIGGTSIISSVLTYLFAKRKYNTEADSTEIKNLQESIKVYKIIIDDLKFEYKELRIEYKELKKEIELMKAEFGIQLRKAREDCKEVKTNINTGKI